MSTLDEIVINAELARRAPRPATPAAEVEVLAGLAQTWADAPGALLQRLVESAMALCRAGTAGIGFVETHADGAEFRWHTAVGAAARDLLAMPSQHPGLYDLVFDRREPQLFAFPARHYTHLAPVRPSITELLIVPFFVGARPAGAIGLLAHNGGRGFDAEDVRAIRRLGAFGAAAVPVVRAPAATRADATAVATIGVESTERKRFEDALFQSEERHRLLIEAASEHAIFMVDPEGRVATWNMGAERILGYRESEIIGQSGSVVFTPEDRARGEDALELTTAIMEGRAEDERWHLRKDGRRFWGSGVMTSLRDAEGTLRGFVKIMRDNTERKRVDEAREHARQLAEAANRSKDEFLATVSHELRTPLAAMQLWVHTLRTGRPGERARAIDAVEQSVKQQSRLIADLLDVSRAMTGKLQLALEPIDMGLAVETTLETMAGDAAARSIVLSFDDDESPLMVHADIDRLQQAVANLVSNAIKFSPDGARIEVQLTREDGRARLTVRDRGRGINPTFLPYVFTAFRQEDASTTRAHGGLGLGLAIVKQIADLHGGEVHAASAGEGHGAVFTLWLPLLYGEAVRATETAEEATTGHEALSGVRVLIVEDDELTRTGMVLVLERAGAVVTAVGTAAEALAAFRRASPDVLLCDLAMPGEDGFAVIRAVRAAEGTSGARVPAAVLTGRTRAEDRAEALAAGFDEHAPKPVAPVALVHLVARLAAHRVP